MSDTRCSIADYQLDVDVLMLEYLLYQAINARFKRFRGAAPFQSEDDENNDFGVSHETTASRTFESFSIFHRQFQRLHPEHFLEPGTGFNVILFESLCLLEASMDGQTNTVNEGLGLDAAEEIRDYLRRRAMTRVMNDSQILLANTSREIYAAEVNADLRLHLLHGNVPSNTQQTPLSFSHDFPIFRLLNRFMVLSARITQPIRGQHINERWMRAACELMLHAALEANDDRLQTSRENVVSSLRPGVLDCFAFHPRHSVKMDSTSEKTLHSTSPILSNGSGCVAFDRDTAYSEEEIAICDMLEPAVEAWDRMRHIYLSELILPEAEASSGHDAKTALDHFTATCVPRVRRKYPLQKTLKSVSDCLENFWTINSMPSLSGKPVLVQIEQGSLEGLLTQGEFGKFLQRVGLNTEKKT